MRAVPRASAILLCLLSLAVLGACTLEERTDRDDGSAVAPSRQVIRGEGGAEAYASAVRDGDLIFLSGQMGTLPRAEPPTLVDGGVDAEARQAMENLVAVLEAGGAGPEDISRCTVFLVDMADHAVVDDVYRAYFPEDPPARSVVAVAELPLGARIQLHCIAAVPGGA